MFWDAKVAASREPVRRLTCTYCGGTVALTRSCTGCGGSGRVARRGLWGAFAWRRDGGEVLVGEPVRYFRTFSAADVWAGARDLIVRWVDAP